MIRYTISIKCRAEFEELEWQKKNVNYLTLDNYTAKDGDL